MGRWATRSRRLINWRSASAGEALLAMRGFARVTLRVVLRLVDGLSPERAHLATCRTAAVGRHYPIAIPRPGLQMAQLDRGALGRARVEGPRLVVQVRVLC